MRRLSSSFALVICCVLAAPARADLVQIAEIQGQIVDATPSRVLYIANGEYRVLNVSTGASQPIPAGSSTPPDDARGQLIDGGAAVLGQAGSSLYLWRNGESRSLGPARTKAHVAAAGDHFVWLSVLGDLRLHTVSTGEDRVIASGDQITGWDVAANGDVVYSKEGVVYRRRGSITTALSDPFTPAQAPETDGSRTAFGVNPPDSLTSLGLHEGAGAVVLNGKRGGITDGDDYALAGGWLAFNLATGSPTTNPTQVWSRSPTGVNAQIAPGAFGTATALIRGVSPGGQALYAYGLGWWAAAAGARPYPLPNPAGEWEDAFFSGGRWYIRTGSQLFRLDPDTRIEAGGALDNDPDMQIRLVSSEPAPAFACALDGQPYAPCADPVALTGLADGPHTFTAAADGDPTPASYSWTVDTTPPEPFALLTPAPGQAVRAERPVFTWATPADVSGITRYAIHFDGVDQSPGGTFIGARFTPDGSFSEGTHSWQVIAYDRTGRERASEVRTFVADRTAPAAPIKIAPANGSETMDTTPTFRWEPASGDLDHYALRIDGVGETELPSDAESYTPTAELADGVYGWTIAAVDAAGNRAAAPPTTFRIETRRLPGNNGVTINGGDQFTNDPDVTITARWPSFTESMLVANDGGFVGATPRELTSTITWRLRTGGPERIPRTVYVRFLGDRLYELTYQDDIVLDTVDPSVQRATRSGRRLKVRARDATSGVRELQVTRNRRRPGVWKRFRANVKVAPSGRLFVRVRDRAGNRSRWRRAAQPRL